MVDRKNQSKRRITIGVLRDPEGNEPGTALSLATVSALAAGEDTVVMVVTGAGGAAGISDEEYEDAGAEIVWTEEASEAQFLLCVNPPSPRFVSRYLDGADRAVVFHLSSEEEGGAITALADHGVTSFGLAAGAASEDWAGLVDRLIAVKAEQVDPREDELLAAALVTYAGEITAG